MHTTTGINVLIDVCSLSRMRHPALTFFGKEKPFAGISAGEGDDRVVFARTTFVFSAPISGWHQDGRGDPQRALMSDQLLIATSAVLHMLMHVDQRRPRRRRRGPAPR